MSCDIDVIQTLAAMKMSVLNKLLEQRAYTDAHTGLPNKDACEVLLNNKETVAEHTACMMFDLNNLKIINDTKGHSKGDQLILNFARLLRNVIPQKDFVGRYGGDEFIAVIHHTSEAEIKEILKSLYREKDRLNSYENQIPIDYACGWALSSDDMACTMQMAMQNRLLEQKAFIDAYTGLPNKNACNELLNKKDIITDSTACIMFDLNNLKTVNDTMGHSAGD